MGNISKIRFLSSISVEKVTWLLVLLGLSLAVGFHIVLFVKAIGGIELGLFVPSMIVVVGSFTVYYLRRYHERERLEAALRTEIDELGELDQMDQAISRLPSSQKPPNGLIPAQKISPADAFPLTVYEQNASEVGRLNQTKAENVVSFYSEMMQLKSVIAEIHAIDARRKENEPEEEERTATNKVSPVELALHKRLVSKISQLQAKREDLLTDLGEE